MFSIFLGVILGYWICLAMVAGLFYIFRSK